MHVVRAAVCAGPVSYTHLVDAQLFDIRNIDLPRKVKYRPRYKKPEFKVDRGCRIERSYADFQKYLGANPETTIVQIDVYKRQAVTSPTS